MSIRHGVEVIDLDLDDAKELLGRFIDTMPEQWNDEIGSKVDEKERPLE